MSYTIVLPISKSNTTLANNCINHLLQNSEYNIYVLSENDTHEKYVTNSRVTYFNWEISYRPPLVQIWNQCIAICPTDNIIITSWRQRPTPEHFKTIEAKLADRYAMVAFDGMHMFSFNKHLTTKIGFFDTGFTAGQLEDTDWWYRLRQKNVAIYVGDVSEERVVNGQHINSCWLDGGANKIYFDTKWKENSIDGTLTIYHEELNKDSRSTYSYLPNINYRSWNESELEPGLQKHFKTFHTVVEAYAN